MSGVNYRLILAVLGFRHTACTASAATPSHLLISQTNEPDIITNTVSTHSDADAHSLSMREEQLGKAYLLKSSAPEVFVPSVQSNFPVVCLMKASYGKCQQKNVWLFVDTMTMAGSPSFGKTLLTRILASILHKNRFDESLKLPRLSCFWFLLSRVFKF